jgi:peptidoglycan/LPS O-acetylase OafA/YrhL
MAMVFVLGHYVQLDVIALLALPLIFVAAHGFHHFVEVPALTLGRRLAGEGKTRTA